MSNITLFCSGQEYSGVFSISFIINIICGLICIISLLHSIYSFTIASKSADQITKRRFKWFLIASAVASIIMTISSVISYIFCYVNLMVESRVMRSVFAVAFYCTIGLAILSLIIRIHDTFKHSVYKIGKRLYSIILSIFFFSVFTGMVGMLTRNMFLYSNKSIATFGQFMSRLGIFLCVFVWIVVSILFVRKLSLVSIECARMQLTNNKSLSLQSQKSAESITKTKSVTGSNSNEKISKTTSNRNNNEKEKVVLVATRYVVLNACCWMMFLALILTSLIGNYKMPSGKRFQILVTGMILFGTVTFVTVYLQYPFTSKVYSKLCACFDRCCYSLMRKCIQIRAGKSLSNEKAMVDIMSNSSDNELSTKNQTTTNKDTSVDIIDSV
eukprot:505728_1